MPDSSGLIADSLKTKKQLKKSNGRIPENGILPFFLNRKP
jgi:hypothetical protein